MTAHATPACRKNPPVTLTCGSSVFHSACGTASKTVNQHAGVLVPQEVTPGHQATIITSLHSAISPYRDCDERSSQLPGHHKGDCHGGAHGEADIVTQGEP